MKDAIRYMADTYDKNTSAKAPNASRIRLVGDTSSIFLTTIAKRCKALGLGYMYANSYRPGEKIIIDVETGSLNNYINKADDVDCTMHDGTSAVCEAIYSVLQVHGVTGKHVVIVGRGHAVKGLHDKLLKEDATVTICHSKTKYLYEATEHGDILILAVPTDASVNVCTYNKKLIVDVGNTLKERPCCGDYVQGRDLGRLTISILLSRCTSD